MNFHFLSDISPESEDTRYIIIIYWYCKQLHSWTDKFPVCKRERFYMYIRSTISSNQIKETQQNSTLYFSLLFSIHWFWCSESGLTSIDNRYYNHLKILFTTLSIHQSLSLVSVLSLSLMVTVKRIDRKWYLRQLSWELTCEEKR